jgi:NTE family protein
MTRRPSRFAVFLLAGLAAALPTRADPAAEDGKRPKIGLVLSGGGARGGVHVGVLKVLEELRVPVDFVAGTSAGALAGGLYASGLSPEEIELAIQSVDWDNVLLDTSARERLSFRRKEDDNLALFPLELGVGKRGFNARPGLAAGENIEFALSAAAVHTPGYLDFDELRIPFRAVAADLETGEAVVLDRGELTVALRASMSIPGVFAPVEWEGRVLVDGGIANNLPVDVARAMGAERIIAVNVGTPPKDPRGLSALGVASQTVNILTERYVTMQIATLGPGDLVIAPELEEISAGQFERAMEAAAAGEEAARSVAAELKRYSVSEEEYSRFLAGQRLVLEGPLPPVVVDEIEARAPEGRDPRVIAGRLRTEPGQALDFELLRGDLDRVHWLGEFEKVGVSILPEEAGNRLVVDAKEKSWGPGYLRFGLRLESGFEGSADYLALAHYRRPEINRFGAEWRSIVSIGETSGLVSEFYQPLHPRRKWFVAPRVTWQREELKAFLPDGATEFFDTVELLAQLEIGVQFSNVAEIRVGAGRGSLEAEPVSTTDFEPVDVDLGGWRLRARVDTMDSPFFPTRGNQTDFDLLLSRESLGATDVYDRGALQLWQAGSLGRNVVFGGLSLGSDFGSGLPVYDSFELGGFLNLSGLQTGELRGNVLGLATLGYYWRAFQLGQVGDIYVGAAAQAGNVWGDVSEAGLSDLRYSGTLFVGADTPFVPLYVGFGVADQGANSFYLFVGQAF